MHALALRRIRDTPGRSRLAPQNSLCARILSLARHLSQFWRIAFYTRLTFQCQEIFLLL
jgi:hypothetical protein